MLGTHRSAAEYGSTNALFRSALLLQMKFSLILSLRPSDLFTAQVTVLVFCFFFGILMLMVGERMPPVTTTLNTQFHSPGGRLIFDSAGALVIALAWLSLRWRSARVQPGLLVTVLVILCYFFCVRSRRQRKSAPNRM